MSIFEKLGIPEKLPLQSKKWIAAMVWTVLWIGAIWYAISKGISGDVISSMVYCVGMIQSLYLGGQAAVDAIVRRATSSKNIMVQNDPEP